MAWTDERIAWLKQLWADGRSASEVATIMGGGLTRAGVCGKVHRLGLPERAKDSRRRHNYGQGRKPERAYKSKPKVVPLKSGPKFETETLPEVSQDDIPTKTFDQIEDGHCKFRIDIPFANEPYGFCGKKSLVGLSWCDQHLRRVVPADQLNSVLLRSRAREKAKKEKEPA